MYVTFKQRTSVRNRTTPDFATFFDNFGRLPEQVATTSTGGIRNFTKLCTPEEALQIAARYPVQAMKDKLNAIAPAIQAISQEDMSEYYETFQIPKRTGGFRRIDAPNPELKELLRKIKDIFEYDLYCLAHDRAFAYVKGRSTKDALEEHQKNESRWFLKLDVKDFFPSCTHSFINQQLVQLFPFAILMQDPEINTIIQNIIHICLLNGHLPQGTPMSPLLTNLIMLPIDETLRSLLRDYAKQNFVYTRYADDLLVSCRYHFNWHSVQNSINGIFQQHNAPFKIKTEKTRYGSSAGRNWNLGLMLNKDNKITIGYRKKQRLRATIFTFLQDLTAGNPWDIVDVQILLGNISYYQKIEPDYVQNLLDKLSAKFNTDFMTEVKASLKA